MFAVTRTEMSACEPRSLQNTLNNISLETVKCVDLVSLSINLKEIYSE